MTVPLEHSGEMEDATMPKKQVVLSRAEELKALEARNEKIRKNPEYGFKLLQKAGIYDKNGQLTAPYRDE